jgi:hypothetical protein
MMIPEAALLLGEEGRLRVPTVIAAGAEDRLVMTGWQSDRLADRVPGSRLRVVEGAGHMVHHTAPDAIVAAIDEAAAMSESSQPPDVMPPRASDSREVNAESDAAVMSVEPAI